MAYNANGHTAGGLGGGPGKKQPFRHIDDLVSVTVDLDPNTPLRKVLEVGTAHLRQANTFADFKRPDLALQEYIKAFTIAVDIVPKHKDYPSLKNGEMLAKAYAQLKTGITDNVGKFDKIKELIKEDNKRSGVQSAKSSSWDSARSWPSVPSTLPSQPKSNGVAPVATNGTTNGSRPIRSSTDNANGAAVPAHKAKPAVHPKPQALHGNAIAPGTKPVSQDLAARFANLRTPKDGLNTADSASQRGSMDDVGSSRPRPTIDSSMPDMPRLPDAIYSPARGTVTSEVADLPSSTPRGMFSRTNSITSSTSYSARNSIDTTARPSEQYTAERSWTPAPSTPTVPSAPPPPVPKVARFQIDDDEYITPQKLMPYIRLGRDAIKILFIDLRDREDFDRNHITWENIICIEPIILSRLDISSEEIYDSMVVGSPQAEQDLFGRRNEFDLVIYYDDDTRTISDGRSREQLALLTLQRALTLYNFKELKHKPKLLRGGLREWVLVHGASAQQPSRTPTRPAGLPSTSTGRRPRAATKKLNDEEIKGFEEQIKADYTRDIDDVLRRFPTTSQLESMTAPVAAPSHAEFEPEILPSPPSRPAPSVPRKSYSGLSSRPDDEAIAMAKSNRAMGSGKPQRLRTGLVNPGYLCYGNSVIQGLFASPGVREEICSADWPNNYKPQPKDADTAPEPQLMARILGNLIQWMRKGHFDVMKATTFMKYCNAIHLPGQPRSKAFGYVGHQEDAAEFLTFVIQTLHKETNIYQKEPRIPEDDPNSKESPYTKSVEYWKSYSLESDSIIDRYYRFLSCSGVKCTKCGAIPGWNLEPGTNISLATSNGKGQWTIQQCLDKYFEAEMIEDYKCEKCQRVGEAVRKLYFAHPPRLLVVDFKRFKYDPRTDKTSKVLDRQEFPFENLDLSPWAILPDTSKGDPPINRDNYTYDLYAIIIHSGPTMASGHYWAWTKVDENRWIKLDDQKDPEQVPGSIVDMRIPAQREALQKKMWENGGSRETDTPYVLFYKRKDQPSDFY